MTYYETYTEGENPCIYAFDTFEEAVEFADNNGCTTIQEMGGSYDDYEKCEFCGEWYPTSEMNIENYCEQCQIAIRDHGFKVDPRKKNSTY